METYYWSRQRQILIGCIVGQLEFLLWFKVHLIYLNTETPKGAQVYSLTVWTQENHQVEIQSEIVPRNWLVSFFGEKWWAVYPLGQTKWLLILAESLERM